MTPLRESHHSTISDGHAVHLDVSHLKAVTIDLLYSFIEVWLNKTCHSPWDLVQAEDDHNHTIIRIIFQDSREAVLFKLGPYGLYNKQTSFEEFCLAWMTDPAISAADAGA